MKDLLGKGIRTLRDDGLSETIFSIAHYSEKRTLIQLAWLLQRKEFRYTDGKWIFEDLLGDDGVWFPHFTDRVRTENDYREQMADYYFESETAPVAEGDIVFDIGAYIGITSMIAAQKASHVYALEPSPRARECLEYNTRNYDNISVLPYAAWNEATEIELEYGLNASEDGLLEPDDGGSGESVMVQAYPIATIAEMEGIDQIDFLKVEAEGAEPEIIDGIPGVPVRKVAAAGNAERLGKTTYEQVAAKLRELGYDVTVHLDHSYKMVYASLGA